MPVSPSNISTPPSRNAPMSLIRSRRIVSSTSRPIGFLLLLLIDAPSFEVVFMTVRVIPIIAMEADMAPAGCRTCSLSYFIRHIGEGPVLRIRPAA